MFKYFQSLYIYNILVQPHIEISSKATNIMNFANDIFECIATKVLRLIITTRDPILSQGKSKLLLDSYYSVNWSILKLSSVQKTYKHF